MRRLTTCALLLVAIAAVPPIVGAQQPHGFLVQGRVIDSLVQPVAGADVEIPSLHIKVSTDSYGRFRLLGVPAGSYTISIRKIGFGPIDLAFTAPRDTSLSPVTLVPGAVVLKTIVTRTVGPYDKPARLAFTGKYDDFYMRRHFNMGSDDFYTREDIDRMDVMDIRDVLRRVPHLQLWEDNGNTEMTFPGCGTFGILIKVDGQQVWPRIGVSNPDAQLDAKLIQAMGGSSGPSGGESDPLATLRSLRPSDIEGIEVYPSSSSLPPEAVGNACAAIFFWTGAR